MDVADRIRLGQDQQVIIALQRVVPLRKTLRRKSSSENFRFWISVPMAPSSTRMRSRAAAASAARISEP